MCSENPSGAAQGFWSIRCKADSGERTLTALWMGFPGVSDNKGSACNAGDLGLIPGLGRSSGGGHGSLLWYSCQKNPMDRGAWRATVHGVAKSRSQLSS